MKNFIGISVFLILIVSVLGAAPAVPEPEINAESAILIDFETETVLYEKNADRPIPPASMTKLMTIHTALGFIRDGRTDADATVPISAAADFRNQPPHSSLMFIEQGQSVTLLELLQGLALPSGNDAGVAVAEYLTGSLESFVGLMNKKAAEMGMKQTHFADSSGYSELNVTTAREYAMFCRIYIKENSRYLEKLHMPLEFTYPKPQNLPSSGESVYGPITQPNHNLLIGRMSTVDGLKTGYIDESGYNFTATATLGERRLVLVTMGGPGSNSSDGSLKRAIDAATLLNYGFYAWTSYCPEVPAGVRAAVRGGSRDSLGLVYSPAAKILVESSRLDELDFIPELRDAELPIKQGSLVGRWKLMLGDEEIQNGIITAAETVEKGNIFMRIFSGPRNRPGLCNNGVTYQK